MEDLRSILTSHHSKNTNNADALKAINNVVVATTSEIPDLFFDEILLQFKLTRTEMLVLMFLYRITWCKPNLHRKFGIAPIISLNELAAQLDVTNEVFHQTIRSLEGFSFIETIRSGQYFVRKYFTEDNDRKYGQSYDNFL
jgi:DNA-binding MarR family transcriptional regulator